LCIDHSIKQNSQNKNDKKDDKRKNVFIEMKQESQLFSKKPIDERILRVNFGCLWIDEIRPSDEDSIDEEYEIIRGMTVFENACHV
jgi:hypothetical protein